MPRHWSTPCPDAPGRSPPGHTWVPDLPPCARRRSPPRPPPPYPGLPPGWQPPPQGAACRRGSTAGLRPAWARRPWHIHRSGHWPLRSGQRYRGRPPWAGKSPRSGSAQSQRSADTPPRHPPCQIPPADWDPSAALAAGEEFSQGHPALFSPLTRRSR